MISRKHRRLAEVRGPDLPRTLTLCQPRTGAALNASLIFHGNDTVGLLIPRLCVSTPWQESKRAHGYHDIVALLFVQSPANRSIWSRTPWSCNKEAHGDEGV